MTLAQLLATYQKNYIAIQRPGTVKNTNYQIGVILRTEIGRADGTRKPFGEWLVSDIGSGTIDEFQRVRLTRGVTASNRDLALLRAMFRWAIGKDHIDRTPFKKAGEPVIKLTKEHKRRRRLRPGEREALLTACSDASPGSGRGRTRDRLPAGGVALAPVVASPVHTEGRIFLPAQKTKTAHDRTVPISTRLRSILEMRRTGPDDKELPGDAYVFGNEVGEPVKRVTRAWERALLKSHGYKPGYTVRVEGAGAEAKRKATKGLAPESRAALRAIDLHFHDLRRECGSRWLEGGVQLHKIQAWLGHANISQTSTYLMSESANDDDAMRAFEARVQRSATDSGTGHQNTARSATITNTETRISSTNHH